MRYSNLEVAEACVTKQNRPKSRPYQDESGEAGGNTLPSECGGSSHNTNDEVDEDDEEPRPAKRRKRPSAIRQSAPVTEYQEWPFQGFLKRTKIGDETTYSLEFRLPCISDCLSLPMTIRSLDTGSDREGSVNSETCQKTRSYSNIRAATSG